MVQFGFGRNWFWEETKIALDTSLAKFGQCFCIDAIGSRRVCDLFDDGAPVAMVVRIFDRQRFRECFELLELFIRHAVGKGAVEFDQILTGPEDGYLRALSGFKGILLNDSQTDTVRFFRPKNSRTTSARLNHQCHTPAAAPRAAMITAVA